MIVCIFIHIQGLILVSNDVGSDNVDEVRYVCNLELYVQMAHVFDKMHIRDVSLWNTLIIRYIRWGSFEEVENLFK
jgi:hypothetical protein